MEADITGLASVHESVLLVGRSCLVLTRVVLGVASESVDEFSVPDESLSSHRDVGASSWGGPEIFCGASARGEIPDES